VRTERSSTFSVGLFSNRYVNLGILAEIVIILALVYLPPLQRIFGTEPFAPRYWLLLLPVPAALFLLEELRKWIVRRTSRPAGGTSR